MTSETKDNHSASAQHDAANSHSTSEPAAQYEAANPESPAQHEALSHTCSDFSSTLTNRARPNTSGCAEAPIPYRLGPLAESIPFVLTAMGERAVTASDRREGGVW